MKATQLKKKYPEVWEEVYCGMIDDLCKCMSGADIQQYKEENPNCRIVRIAHNAAFLACYSVYQILK
jgi:hypothetical protein